MAALTPAQQYCFDCSGYLVLRAALQPSHLATVAASGPAQRAAVLGAQPGVRPVLVALAELGQPVEAPGFSDWAPELYTPQPGSEVLGAACRRVVVNHPTALERLRSYDCRNALRLCERLTVLVPLDDPPDPGQGRLAISVASHQARLELPRQADALAGSVRPPLRRGDVAILCAGLCWGLAAEGGQRLLRCDYRSAVADYGADAAPVRGLPQWAAKLGPAERAILLGEKSPSERRQQAADAVQAEDKEGCEAAEELYHWEKDG